MLAFEVAFVPSSQAVQAYRDDVTNAGYANIGLVSLSDAYLLSFATSIAYG